MDDIKKSVVLDICFDIDQPFCKTVQCLIQSLQVLDAIHSLQIADKLDLRIENVLYQRVIDVLKKGGKELPEDAKIEYMMDVNRLEEGIYDLIPITLKRSGKDYVELILGKIFSFEKNDKKLYCGAAGIINNAFDNLIKGYDRKLNVFSEKLNLSINNRVPLMKCMDVFALSGELDVRHKPICVFYSGNGYENTSALSNLSVFINIYVSRFKLISKEIAKRYLLDYSLIENVDDYTIGMLLILWLRGHDLGHFFGEDKLRGRLSEMDKNYLILHELKSDLISLYNMRFLRGDLLKGGLIDKAYTTSIAEMLRYIRRGHFFNYPDSGSAYLTYRYLRESGSLVLDSKTKGMKIDFMKLERDIEDFTMMLLKLFRDGDVTKSVEFVNRWGDIRDLAIKKLPVELEFLEDRDIPYYLDFNFVLKEANFR